MVNQLLTEMDGFRKDELVFVVGTTNFVEILDPALLRPGRFEFHLHIPYPDDNDRRAIFEIYNEKLELSFSERALEYGVKRTADPVEGTGGRYSGDHIQALCRALARMRLRGQIVGDTEIAHIEDALTRYLDRPELTREEERVVATHEAGHAVVALHTEHSPPIERISIQGDLGGALGHVRYADPAHRYVVTRGQLLDSIATLFGGREAEALLLEDISIGSASDLHRATATARALVEQFGLGDPDLGVRRFLDDHSDDNMAPLSDATRAAIDRAVARVLEEQRARAAEILYTHQELVIALRELLLERKVLDRQSFAHLLSGGEKSG